MMMMMMMILLPRLRRLSMGMVAHCSYHGSYRFSYISRGTPGGATHSVLLLHGFSANKDSWLPIIKVPAPLQWWWTCERHEQLCQSAQSWNVLLSAFYTSRASLSSPCSISPKTGMSCVWICQDTRERVAQESRTTATRARSAESTRSVAHGTQNRLYVLSGWRSCSLEEALLFQFFLVFQFLQFVQSVGLDKRPFHLVGTSMGGHVAGVYAAQYPANVCSLTLICPSGKLSMCFQVWLFYLQKPWDRAITVSASPGLICPTESKFMVDFRESQERQQTDSIALIPSTLQELGNLLKLGCYKPATLPKQVSYTADAMFWKNGFPLTKSLSIFNFSTEWNSIYLLFILSLKWKK